MYSKIIGHQVEERARSPLIWNHLYKHLEIESEMKKLNLNEDKLQEEVSVFDSIRDWAQVRGIYNSGDSKTQFAKLVEEVGELARAVSVTSAQDDYKSKFLLRDAIGDIMVVLINMCARNDLSLRLCLYTAYDQIKDRKGTMVNGIFVKEETNG